MIVKLLTEYHLEFLSLKGGCRGSSESTLVKMSNCWKSHAAAQILNTDTILILFELRLEVPVMLGRFPVFLISTSKKQEIVTTQCLL